MILSRRVKLNGQHLDELHSAIVIRGVDPGTTKENITAVDLMGGFGQRVTGSHFQTLEAKVSYAIDIPKERIAERRAVFDAVNAWAVGGGWLYMNEIPGRRAYIDKVILPSAKDLRDWMEEFEITFRAYAVPFWQDDTPTQATKNGVSDGSVQLQVNGNTETVFDIKWKNTSGASVNIFRVWEVGGSSITLTNFPSVPGNGVLELKHTNDGLLVIKSGNTDVTSYLGAGDDTFIKPGLHTIKFSTLRAGNMTISAYGRYL